MGWIGWGSCSERRVDEAVDLRSRIGGRRHGDAVRDGGSDAAAVGGLKVEVAVWFLGEIVEAGVEARRAGEIVATGLSRFRWPRAAVRQW